MTGKIHLITYGNDFYKHQRILFRYIAKDSKFFDSVKVFTPFNLDKEFKSRFRDILTIQKGAGYWIWKPYLLKKVMEKIPYKDILIYCDAGCLINKKGKERFDFYIKKLDISKTGSLEFELTHREYEYTKQEVFNYFNCDEKIKVSKQLSGGTLLFKKCSHSVFLINTYFKSLNNNPSLFTDEKDARIQGKEFINHRHDQSVFSIIRKQLGTDLLPDETYFPDFLKYGEKISNLGSKGF